jgi:hypothetical protein
LEDVIELICKFRWPAHGAGPYKSERSIIRDARRDSPTVYQMPGFYVTLLRNADAFERFCNDHLTELRTRIQDPWEVWVETVVPDGYPLFRRMVPPGLSSSKFGPNPADQLEDVHEILRVMVDTFWTDTLQVCQAMNFKFLEDTGMTCGAMLASYKWLWGTKDESHPDLEAVDDRLRTGYIQAARVMLREGDDETAAQYSQVAFDLSPTEDTAEELAAEFAHLRERWVQLTVVKENTVKKVATVAREGIAWWASSLWDDLYRKGHISPITDEVERHKSSGEMEAGRERIKGYSATHPYRRGLELMETVETNLGVLTAYLADMITEWPLEELRRRVPASTVVEEVRKGSPWAPDTRMGKLAELSRADVRQVPFTGEVMPFLHTIYTHLDDDLPGILTCALEQLPDSQGKL